MSKSFDWKKDLTERERFISWISLLVGLSSGLTIVIAICVCLGVF